MYEHILAATDGTELATAAVARAGELAVATGAKLTLVFVSAPPPSFSTAEIGWSVPAGVYDQIRQGNAALAKRVLEGAASAAKAPVSKALHIEDRAPAEGILEAAADIGADLIVMASHGHRGIDRLILGSQAAKVLALAKVSVLIAK